MTRDGLPRAYLRIDPNIDHTIGDLEGFIRLLCAAARQPERGRFRDRAILERALGKARVGRMLTRGDVALLDDGRIYVEGWDEWQEGDWTVAERMRRMRDRRRVARVTPPPSPRRTPVTTDAGSPDSNLEGIGDGVGVLPPNPPPSGGLRANGTNPRALAAKEREGERNRAHQARLEATRQRAAELRAIGRPA